MSCIGGPNDNAFLFAPEETNVHKKEITQTWLFPDMGEFSEDKA